MSRQCLSIFNALSKHLELACIAMRVASARDSHHPFITSQSGHPMLENTGPGLNAGIELTPP